MILISKSVIITEIAQKQYSCNLIVIEQTVIEYTVVLIDPYLHVRHLLTTEYCTRKLSYHKDAPYNGCTENSWESLTTHTTTFRKVFNGLLFRSILCMNVRTKIEVCSFTLSRDNRGYPKNLVSRWICSRSLSPEFLMAFCSDGSCKCTCQI